MSRKNRRVHRPGELRDDGISIAKITSPSGWREPGQTPEFDEYTVVLKGELQVETRIAVHKVFADQAIVIHPMSGYATALQAAAGKRPSAVLPKL